MNISFLVDENLLGLLRKLRMMGVDSVALKGLSDNEIYSAALSDGRIILTKDRQFFQSLPIGEAYFVKGDTPTDQLIEVLKEFIISEEDALSRCFDCNTHIEKVTKTSVKKRVDPKTFSLYENFYECPTCHRIYWEGSHFEKLQKEVQSISQRVHSLDL